MIPESSAASASRSSQQNRSSHAGATSSGAVTQSGDDSGNENQQKSVRRRKRAHTFPENVKRKKAKGGCSGAKAGARKQKHVEAVTLFEVMSMGKSAMQVVIDDWIEAYGTDKDSSLLDLISFFLQCSGCKGVITAEMCQSKEGRDVMRNMVEELDEVAGLQYKKFLAFPWILTVTWPLDSDSAEYPLMQSGPHSRWFHTEFSEFVSVLVAQCQHTIIFDSYLMSAVISLLSELSNSYVRAFRHTFTLAATKLLSSLMGVALSLSVGIENSQKLYGVQRTKTARQRSTQQLERLQKKITELQEKRAEIESMMDVIFKGIFLKRYRDVLPEIRSICMEELGLWMKLYSSLFLNDSYLKYIGWMMYDKTPDVRLKCMLALQGLYGDPALLPKLDLFTSRFKDRIISMTLDKDNEVAVQTMKLLVLISRTSEDVLTPEDHNRLLQFVYCSQRPLAAAAGEFLFSRLLSAEASETQDSMYEEDIHAQQTYTRIKALLKFYQESEAHTHVVYLVDSLWDCGGALLKDWPTLTSVLLQDSSPQGSGFSSAEQAVLVEILVASVRQASEGPLLAGRSGAKKVLNAREKKCQIDDCLKLTEHLLVVLPQLLSKYSYSCDIVASLIKIPQYFLTQSQEAENSEQVCSLVAEMASVLDLHSSPAVLEAAARTYLSLCGEGTAWCSVVSAARDSLVESWMEHLKDLLKDSLSGDGFSADEEKLEDIVTTTKKLRTFHSCHDLSRWNLFDLLYPLLSEEVICRGAPAEILEEVLQCLSLTLLWSLNKSSELLTSREKAVAQRLQLCLFSESSHRCLSHGSHRVRSQAFLGVCDILTAHWFQLHVWDPTCFGPLLFTPSPKLQRALLTFACTHVFVGADGDSQSKVGESPDEEKLENLHRRRNLLAAFCKLIVHGVLETSMAAEVYMFYMKYNNDFGDIIKEMLFRTRQTDKIGSARTLVLCLQQLFLRLKQEQERGDGAHPGVQTFTTIKELARRFALSFGDLVKFRECVVMIHRSGIEFAFQESSPDTAAPPYLSYLTILSEFSSKLLKLDKKTVFSYLQKHTAVHVDLREECWKPLVHYRASLLAVADMEDAVSHGSSDKRPCMQNRSPSGKQKHEAGNKSPCQISPVNSKTGKTHRPSISSSHQVDKDPPARSLNIDGSNSSCSKEADDGTVEVEF
ncbi:cohesin subunit SA-2 isoform X1 [Oryzias melastigma]|uniref:Cohesin subunit SA n=2 Tax=Oryzias melastigma TaxID=30732 RepID=A0A3B3DKP2_ORYME|nr:cohesin subunit SA-2 isoform X1 [Oryzias melastigma]